MKNTLFCVLMAMLALPAIAGDAARVGDAAPDFELPDQAGQLHSLEDYRDSWVVLYFYPKDGTPGCTREACEFRDNIIGYRELNAQIIGISLDDVESHGRFAEKHTLPFPLLADTDGAVAEAYGVKTRLFGFPIARRETFIISPAGILVKHYKKVDPKSHATQVKADLETLSTSKTISAAP